MLPEPLFTARKSDKSKAIWPFRSLMARVLSAIVLPMVILQVITVSVFYDVHWRAVTNRLVQSVKGEMLGYATVLQQHPAAFTTLQETASAQLSTRLRFYPGATLIPVEDPGLQWFFRIPFDERFDRLGKYQTSLSRSVTDWRQFVYQLQLDEGVVEMTFIDKRLVSPTIATYLTWLVLSFLVVALVAIFFMRRQMIPILDLARSANRYGRNLPLGKLAVKGASEIRIAIRAFNDMRYRFESFRRQQREMLLALSHDVRAPLARMRLQTSFLPQSEHRRAIETDIETTDHMLQQFVEFARDRRREGTSNVDVKEIINKANALYSNQLNIKTVHPTSMVTVSGREQDIFRVFCNLLDNAARFAAELRIEVKILKGNLRVTLDDDGPGIPGHLYRKVLRPFFRIDKARTPSESKHPKTGLGLGLCALIVQQHGGRMRLRRSKSLGGLKVEIYLPDAKS